MDLDELIMMRAAAEAESLKVEVTARDQATLECCLRELGRACGSEKHGGGSKESPMSEDRLSMATIRLEGRGAERADVVAFLRQEIGEYKSQHALVAASIVGFLLDKIERGMHLPTKVEQVAELIECVAKEREREKLRAAAQALVDRLRIVPDHYPHEALAALEAELAKR